MNYVSGNLKKRNPIVAKVKEKSEVRINTIETLILKHEYLLPKTPAENQLGGKIQHTM